MITRIKRYFALRTARKRAIMLGKMIDAIDNGFEKHGLSRQKRRQFWQDFVLSPENRKKFIDAMSKNGL